MKPQLPSVFRNKVFVLGLIAFLTLGTSCSHAARGTDFGQVAVWVAKRFDESHLSSTKRDDAFSKRFLNRYLEVIDSNKLFFTQADVDKYHLDYGSQLDDLLLNHDISPAFHIFDDFCKKFKSRIAWLEKTLPTYQFDFDKKRSVELSRRKSAWPVNDIAANKIWIDRLASQFLEEEIKAIKDSGKISELSAENFNLSDHPDLIEKLDALRKKIIREQNRKYQILINYSDEEKAGIYLSSLAHTYDPHSDYMTKLEFEQFSIDMKKYLVGIGALIGVDDDDRPTVKGIAKNGPAYKQGELQINDRIVGVGQGKTGKIEDVALLQHWRVINLIRGQKNTSVRLCVQPAGTFDPAKQKIITIDRDRVETKRSRALGELIKFKTNNNTEKHLGIISLDSFYTDSTNRGASATKDVRMILDKLMDEKIDGLVFDLRDNGGGSLDEAIKMTDLFIRKGPVVHILNSIYGQKPYFARGQRPVYSGPMIVLTNKQSASASEILAAALQDYRRAIIVGDDSTYGKGTVQELFDISRTMPIFSARDRAGMLKITTQKFYRVTGGSTQEKGVIPDIHLPSIFEAMEIGESLTDNPLPYDEITPTKSFTPYNLAPLPVPQLTTRSKERIKNNIDFRFINEEKGRIKTLIEDNTTSLNFAERLQKLREDETRKKTRRAAREKYYAEILADENKRVQAYKIYIETDSTTGNEFANTIPQKDFDPDETFGMIVEKDLEKEEEKIDPPHGLDAYLRESLCILNDLIDMTPTNKTVTVQADKPIKS